MSLQAVSNFFKDPTPRTQSICFGQNGINPVNAAEVRSAAVMFNLELRETPIAASYSFSDRKRSALTRLKERDPAIFRDLFISFASVTSTVLFAYLLGKSWKRAYQEACIEFPGKWSYDQWSNLAPLQRFLSSCLVIWSVFAIWFTWSTYTTYRNEGPKEYFADLKIERFNPDIPELLLNPTNHKGDFIDPITGNIIPSKNMFSPRYLFSSNVVVDIFSFMQYKYPINKDLSESDVEVLEKGYKRVFGLEGFQALTAPASLYCQDAKKERKLNFYLLFNESTIKIFISYMGGT